MSDTVHAQDLVDSPPYVMIKLNSMIFLEAPPSEPDFTAETITAASM